MQWNLFLLLCQTDCGFMQRVMGRKDSVGVPGKALWWAMVKAAFSGGVCCILPYVTLRARKTRNGGWLAVNISIFQQAEGTNASSYSVYNECAYVCACTVLSGGAGRQEGEGERHLP